MSRYKRDYKFCNDIKVNHKRIIRKRNPFKKHVITRKKKRINNNNERNFEGTNNRPYTAPIRITNFQKVSVRKRVKRRPNSDTKRRNLRRNTAPVESFPFNEMYGEPIFKKRNSISTSNPLKPPTYPSKSKKRINIRRNSTGVNYETKNNILDSNSKIVLRISKKTKKKKKPRRRKKRKQLRIARSTQSSNKKLFFTVKKKKPFKEEESIRGNHFLKKKKQVKYDISKNINNNIRSRKWLDDIEKRIRGL